MPKIHCKDCDFFEPQKMPIPMGTIRKGTCRFFPADPCVEGGWVLIEETEWCAESKLRKENEKDS